MGLFGRPENDLKTRVATLEKEITNLKLEWSDVLDKVLHRLQRQATRDRREIATISEPRGIAGLEGTRADPPPEGRWARKAALRQRAGLIGGRYGNGRQDVVSPEGQAPQG